MKKAMVIAAAVMIGAALAGCSNTDTDRQNGRADVASLIIQETLDAPEAEELVERPTANAAAHEAEDSVAQQEPEQPAEKAEQVSEKQTEATEATHQEEPQGEEQAPAAEQPRLDGGDQLWESFNDNARQMQQEYNDNVQLMQQQYIDRAQQMQQQYNDNVQQWYDEQTRQIMQFGMGM